MTMPIIIPIIAIKIGYPCFGTSLKLYVDIAIRNIVGIIIDPSKIIFF